MIIISLSRGSDMPRMGKIIFWLPYLKGSDLALSQIAMVKTVKHLKKLELKKEDLRKRLFITDNLILRG